MKKFIVLLLALCSIFGQAQPNKIIFDWWANSSTDPFSRPEILEVIDPNCASCLTVDANGKVTQIRGRKGVLTFNQSASLAYSLVEYNGGKSFFSSVGTNYYLSNEFMPQVNYSIMVVHNQSLASPIFWTKNAGTTPFIFRHVSGVPTINTSSIVSPDTFVASTEHSTYWEKTATGLGVGTDGVRTTTNATILTSPSDAVIRLFNGSTAINGPQGYIGPLVVFNRALTDTEITYWNQKIKSYWRYGYEGVLPFSNVRDGNNFSWFISDNFPGFNPNSGSSPMTSQWSSNAFSKGANSYLINNPHDGRTNVKSPYSYMVVDAATATITQAQPFTVYGLVNWPPSYKANLNYRQFLNNTQSTDNISITHDKTNGVIRMQGVGSVGTGGATLAYTPGDWTIIKAVYNGASSYLEVDGVQSATFNAGSLGLTGTTTLSPGADIFIAAMGLYNGVPTGTIDAQTKAYLYKVRAVLPDYRQGAYVVNDNFNTNHYGFGGITGHPTNGTLYSVARKGLNHIDLQSQIVFSKSTDAGVTWSTATSITGSLVTNFDYRDPRITRLSSGRLVVNYFLRFNTSTYSIKTRYSDDDGATWSSETTATPTTTRTQIGVSGYVIELGNGDLLMPFYGFDAGNTNQINGVFRSTNGGTTWSEDSVFNNSNVGDTAWQEFNILLLQNGTIAGFIRREYSTASKEIWKITGTVGTPITWGTPAKCADGYGSPGVSQDIDGTIYLMHRNKDLGLWLGIQTSTDNGASFTPIKLPENHSDLWTYGRVFIDTLGRKWACWFQQNTDSKSFWRVIRL